MKRKYWALVAALIIAIAVVVTMALWNRKKVLKRLDDQNTLSANFKVSEFVRTATGIDNVPGTAELHNIKLLVENVLQPLRDALGKPIRITSGYRSELVNRAIGGAGNSQHVTGQAADFQVSGMTNAQIIEVIRSMALPYDQLIDEVNGDKSWVHISYAEGNNRGNWLTYRNGEYTLISKNYA